MVDVTSCEKGLLTNYTMTSFYYYFQSDSEYCFFVQMRAFAVIKPFRIAQF